MKRIVLSLTAMSGAVLAATKAQAAQLIVQPAVQQAAPTMSALGLIGLGLTLAASAAWLLRNQKKGQRLFVMIATLGVGTAIAAHASGVLRIYLDDEECFERTAIGYDGERNYEVVNECPNAMQIVDILPCEEFPGETLSETGYPECEIGLVLAPGEICRLIPGDCGGN